MTNKTIRCLDHAGRVLIPSHIRKALNLSAGEPVEIDMTPDGTINIRTAECRCVFCGEKADTEKCGEIKVGAQTKYVCLNCGKIIVRNMTKK